MPSLTDVSDIRDPEGHSNPDDRDEEEAAFTSRKGIFVVPPTLKEAEVTIVRLEGIRMFLGTYVGFEKANPGHRGNWTKASEETVAVRCEKKSHAVKLREWARAFIDSQEEIPENKYGQGSKSIHLHLQGIGKYVKAEDIVRYCKKPDYVDRHEQKDVVKYRQNVFLPAMKAFEERLRRWSKEHGWDLPPTVWRAIVIWFHDESTFYAHNRRE
ncbi:hypothetical protein B0H34DRAFT_736238 [Crassisporium funariophilum]|nr:hypothetical protein B0H34DRAFT_736238 [Crassisporium funariophilum]